MLMARRLNQKETLKHILLWPKSKAASHVSFGEKNKSSKIIQELNIDYLVTLVE